MKYFLPLLLVVVSFHLGYDYLHFQWFTGISLLGLFLLFSFLVFHRLSCSALSTTVLCAIAYFTCNAAYVFAYRGNRFSQNISEIKSMFAYSAIYQLVVVILLLVAIRLIAKFSSYETILKSLGIWALFNSAYVISGHVFGFGRLPLGIGDSGFIDYASVNGGMIAALIPLAASQDKYWSNFWAVVACVLATVFSKSSIPLGVLAVVFISDFFVQGYYRELKAFHIIASILLGLIAVAVAFHFDHQLFDSAYRSDAYRLFMRYWVEHANVFVGFGPGTFSIIAPSVQNETGFMVTPGGAAHYWLYLHSDWLQCLFENGIVGLTFIVMIFFLSLRSLYRNARKAELVTLIALGASSAFNFPVRYFMGSFMLSAIVMYAIHLEEYEY